MSLIKTIFPSRRALFIAYFLIALVIITPFIANDVPVVAQKNGAYFFPVFEQLIKKIKGEPTLASTLYPPSTHVVSPLLPFRAETTDLENINQPPGFYGNKHLLGTDGLGKDVLAILLYGLRYALFVGLGTAIISGVIGICIGLVAGYYGDYKKRINIRKIPFYGTAGILLFYLSLPIPLSTLVQFLGILICCMLFYAIKRIKIGGPTLAVPIDNILMRFVEITEAIPKLLLILSLAAFLAPNSLADLILILGLLNWQEIAKFVRAQTLSLRSKPYVQVAENAGLSTWKILAKHILPKTLTQARIQLLMVISMAIISESVLSFLSIGTDATTMTWGKLMSQGLQNIYQWWVIVFPSACIVVLVWYFYSLAFEIRNKASSKKKID